MICLADIEQVDNNFVTGFYPNSILLKMKGGFHSVIKERSDNKVVYANLHTIKKPTKGYVLQFLRLYQVAKAPTTEFQESAIKV